MAQAQDSAKSPSDCPLKQYASIDLRDEKGIFVPVSVDGHAGFMLLEIGVESTYIWDTFVKEAHIPANWVGNFMHDEEARTFVVRVTDFRLGTARLGKALPRIIPAQRLVRPALGGPVIGLLGMDALAKIDFELDIAHRKLNLFSPDHCPGRVVYWTSQFASTPLQKDSSGRVFVIMELDNQKLQATFVITHEHTTLHKSAAKKLFGFDKGPDGSSDNYVAMKLTAPGLVAQNVRIDLESRPSIAGCSLIMPGVARYGDDCGYYPLELGANLLGALRLYFANKEKVLYYSVADAK